MISRNTWRGPLQPNCLMTHKPLVFLCRNKSWLQKCWARLTASFLAQHGYEVYLLSLPTEFKLRQLDIPENLLIQCQNVHLFYEEEVSPVIDRLLLKRSLNCQSLNCLPNENPLDWAIKQCQNLAEMDFFIFERSKNLAHKERSRQT